MKNVGKRLLGGLLATALVFTSAFTALASEAPDFLDGGLVYRKLSPSSAKAVELVQYPEKQSYESLTGALELPETVLEQEVLGSTSYTLTCLAAPSGPVGDGTFIHPGALQGLRITSLTIPGTVTTIESKAVADCSLLAEVVFPTSVTSLSGDAFSGSPFSKLTLHVTKDSVLQDNQSYRASDKALAVQLPREITNLKASKPLAVSGNVSVPGDVDVSAAVTVAGGANFEVAGSLSGGASVQVANNGTLTLRSASVTGYTGRVKLTGAASKLVNLTTGPVRFENASGTVSVAQAGETVTGGTAVTEKDPAAGAENRPQITVTDGGTVSVQGGGKVVIINAFRGYHVEEVVINGLSMGAITRYEFTKADKENTVAVTFAKGDVPEGPDNLGPDPIFQFKDVDPEGWYADSISFMVRNKIFYGVGNDEFAPSDRTTRAMFVTLLYRLDDYDEQYALDCDSPAPLTDVKKKSWYEDAARWAVGTGVSTVTGTKFKPAQVITREEIGVYLYNFTKALGGDVEASEGVLDGYSDKDQISPEARPALAWAVTHGYLTGRSGDKLEPFSGAMRSEISEILMRYLIANA